MKTCTKCGIEKELTEFCKNKRKNNGFQSNCKICECERLRKYREANPEKTIEINRKWREANPEKNRERNRKWREANQEKNRERNRKWREANLEKSREYSRKRQENNPEKEREKGIKWREANPEKQRAIAKKTHEKYPEKGKARNKFTHELRAGKIIRPTNCSRCDFVGMIEGHHHDYSKPLNVIWLCRKCHAKEHRRLREIEENNDQDIQKV